MKILFFLLFSIAALGQTFTLQDGTKLLIPDDIWKNAIHVNASTPQEIQFAPDVQVKFIIIEVPKGGKTIRIAEALAPVVLKQTIDDTQLKYSSKNATINPAIPAAASWNTFNKAVAPFPEWTEPFHNDTGTFSNAINTTVSLEFTGKKVKVWGEISNNKGIAGIKLNADPEVTKDLYAATGKNNSQVIYESDVLPQGNHSITIRVTGNKNTASTENYVLIDKVEIFE